MKNILLAINISALFLFASLLCIDDFDQKLERAIKSRRINVTYENGDRILALNPVVLDPSKITYKKIALIGSSLIGTFGCIYGITGILLSKGVDYKVFTCFFGSVAIGSNLLARKDFNDQLAENKDAIEVVNHHFVCLQRANNQRK
jgi:hypothetical protein